mgnify:CR=1 FL=1
MFTRPIKSLTNLKLSSLLFGLRCSQICKIVLFVQIAKGLLLPEAYTKLDLKVTDTIQNPGPEYAGQDGDGIVSNGAQGTLAFELRPEEEHCQ